MTSKPLSPRRRHILSSINPELPGSPKSPGAHSEESEPRLAHRDSEVEVEDEGERRSHGSSRFRFKSKRSHHSRRHDRERDDESSHHRSHDRSHRHRHKRHKRPRTRSRSRTPPNPHEAPPLDPEAAFRESLFDAMADDEGASYWEGVYGQPIHVYSRDRPSAQGELEQMDDEEYASYVRQKMWEKTHAGLLEERARREEQRKERDRKQEESRKMTKEMERSLRAGEERAKKRMWREKWESYAEAWAKWNGSPENLRWPVASTDMRDVGEVAIRDFYLKGMDLETLGEKEFFSKLKEERVRWHPDKMQQKLGGKADEALLRNVTAVFQIIDKLWADIRSNSKG